MFNKVKILRASEEVVEQLKEAVFSGALSPGDRLPSERDLASEFGVSRVTIREAIRKLEASGILRVKVGVNGGAFVAEPTTQIVRDSLTILIRRQKATLHEIAEARKVVETATAGLAALRADEEDIAAMERSLEDHRDAITDDASALIATFGFHAALAKAARNPVLLAAVESFLPSLTEALVGLRPVESALPHVLESHKSILEAVKRRDSAEARRLMEVDMDNFDETLSEVLEVEESQT